MLDRVAISKNGEYVIEKLRVCSDMKRIAAEVQQNIFHICSLEISYCWTQRHFISVEIPNTIEQEKVFFSWAYVEEI